MQKAYALDVITFERASLTVEAGTTVTLSPTLHESTLLAVFVWYKDGTLLLGLDNDTLTLNNVQPSDAGVYRVTYVSALGALLGSASITLNVGETITLSDQTVTEGQEISIVSSILTSAIDPSFSWSKDGSPLPSVTGSSFTKASAEASDSGTYEVIYFDGEQEIGRASTTLTIAAPVPPQLTGGDTVSADATLTSQVANGIDLLNGAGFSLDTDITLPSGALLSIAANGSFTYNPNGQFDHLYDGESETDSFTLANVAGSTTITLTINGVGEPIIPPQITGSATVAVNAILNSQIDNGIDLLNGVTLVTDTDITLPSGATVNISASGALTYNPNGAFDHLTNGQSETDSFTVANVAGTTTINITLNGVGEPAETDPPQVTGDTTVAADSTLTLEISNSVDEVNGATFTHNSDIALPSGATVNITATGTLTYDPNGAFDTLPNGDSTTDSFTLGNSVGTTNVTLTIDGTAEPAETNPPQVTGDTTVAADSTLTLEISNSVDEVNGATFTHNSDIALPSGATVNITATGTLTYDPNGAFDTLPNGDSTTDSFALGNSVGTTNVTLTIDGTAEPAETNPPQVTGDTTVAADSTLTLEISNSVDEVNGASFTHNSDIALPSGATVNITATGTLTYDPNGAFDTLPEGDSTTDSFALGNSVGTTNVTVTIDGTAEPAETNPPQVTGDTTVAADSTLTLEISNSVDEVNGATFTHNSDIALPSGATVNITATGTLTYDPNGAFDTLPEGDSTTDSFALGNSIGTTNVTVTIDGTAEPAETNPPQVTGDTTVAADSTLTLEISNSVDEVNGAPFTHNSDIALPSGATVNITATGTLTYDPNGAFDTLPEEDSTTDSFALGNSIGTTNVTLTIDGTDDGEPEGPPQLTGGNTVAADGILNGQIANGVDELNGATFAKDTDIALPSGALISIADSGAFTYNPNGQFNHLSNDETATESFSLGNERGTSNINLTINGAGVDEQEAATILAAKQEKIEETQRTISTYTARRANQITSNSPELTVRLNADYITNPGTPAQFFATGSIANYQMKFSTSLRQMLHANEHRKAKQRMALASNGLEPLSLADDISNTGFDIWVRGQWSDVRTDTSESELGLLQIGMDYRFNENLVVGFLTRFDWTDEVNKSIDQDLNGAGWLAGPYMVTRLHKNLMFDASASWGQSDNKNKTGGNPAENYETDRMLLTGRLTGDFDFNNINFRPHIGVIYYQENIKGYTDNDDNYIPGQTVELGRFTFGPKVTLKFKQDDGTVIAPYVATRGIWDFLKEDKIDSQTGFAVSSDNLRARVDAGLNIRLPSGIKINGEGFYDGIGADDYQAIGGNIKVNVPLN